MKNTFYLFLSCFIFGFWSCQKTQKNTMQACSVAKKGIFLHNGEGSTKNYCTIDSVVLQHNAFTIWFTEPNSMYRYKAVVQKHDKSSFESGFYYFVKNPNNINAFDYPSIDIELIEISSSQTTLGMYDQYPVCIQNNDDSKAFGMLIEGIKIFGSHSYSFMTLSLENEKYIAH